MKMLFKNVEEYKEYQNGMKDVFGENIKFVVKNDLRTKESTYEWMLNIGGKVLAGEAVFEDNGVKNNSGNDKSFIEQRISNLKKEAELLDNKIAAMNTREDFGTYKNLIKAYSEILRLIERYDWQLMYSEYYTDGKKQVAVWEQNGDGNIKNHKVWDIREDAIFTSNDCSGRPM